MIVCTGTLAEKYALPYVEGTLPGFEAERFEAHYFDCPACMDYLTALLAVGEQIRRRPIELPAVDTARAPLQPQQWTSRVWALGAVAAMLVVGVFAWRTIGFHTALPAVAHNSQPANAPSGPVARPAASPVRASQLADLAMPAFASASLRGDSADRHFEAGMNAYSRRDCQAAVSALDQVPAAAVEAQAAQFYLGACQMHLNHRTAASSSLRKVADAGDSPQQESALYYLAQISLLENDPVQAHRYLTQTIDLRGDLLQRSRAEDGRVVDLIGNRTANAR